MDQHVSLSPNRRDQPINAPRFAEACRVLEDGIAAEAFPGCAFGVQANGKVVLCDARGRFTYEPESPAVKAETVFDLASVSKVVATTAVAMLLSQRGKLNLDTRLSEILPAFVERRGPRDPARSVTLKHLLAHNSGLPSYIEFFKSVNSPEALLAACLQLQLESEPGTEGNYSDPGFILLGTALQSLIGEPLNIFAGREIFVPLGMVATGYCPAPEVRASIPPTEIDSSYRGRRIQGEVQDENAWLLGGVAGHAGLFSNVPDVLRLASSVISSRWGDRAENNLFEATTVEVFETRQGPVGSSRALGWDTPSKNSSSGRQFSPRSIGHLGYSGCSLWIDLEAHIAVVLLTNRTWPDLHSQLISQVRPAFHDAVRQVL